MRETCEGKKILEDLCQVPDPRSRRGIRYKLEDLLLIILYAYLAGHSCSSEIEYYAELHEEYFRQLLGMKQMPSHDTFSRVKQMVDLEALTKELSTWLRMRFDDICKRYDGYRVLHVDGKAVLGAAAKSEGARPVYLLNAMYEGGTVSLYTKQINEKENEISALPEYLSFFDLRDTIVTIDAIVCSTKIIEMIHEKGGRYILPVKDNNIRLKEVILAFIKAQKESGAYETFSSTERVTKGHGRIERIKAVLIEDTTFIYEALGLERFYGTIARVGVIEKTVTQKIGGKEVTERTQGIVISDVETLTAEMMLSIKLSHWNIESQHWLLDMVLDEDRQTERKGNATGNGSVLRRFCLAMRQYDPEMAKKPLSRFLMRNEAYIDKIEELLFGKVAAG